MMPRVERKAGDEIVALGRALYDRGITPGRTGNLSVRVGGNVLLTPTGVSLGRLDVEGLSLVSLDGTHLQGGAPTKESALHLALYERFPEVGAVAHGHTTHAVAWSCRTDLDIADALPPLTAYFAMRVGRLPLIGYAPPGDPALAQDLRAVGAKHALLANHGSIASGSTLEAAVDALEEIEETARIALLLNGIQCRSLSADQVSQFAG
ncbi:MAG: class II aldolase/adducin family protein [Humibacillus sp.]|nr:class II aldolase/adducin family protein [Humibacillus sp.]MDN5779018.1 class II aldolase/adducin family protein [Humibacillus sp.]